MPELPEVETIVRELRAALVGSVISNVWTNTALVKPVFSVQVGTTHSISIPKFKKALLGAAIVGIERRGKLIIIELSNGYFILVHLKMTGQMRLNQTDRTKHTHIVLSFEDGQELHYNDMRRFGFWTVTDKAGVDAVVHSRFKFGPEPLEKEFVLQYFIEALQKKNTPIKTALLNQSLVAGVGNIYADEALFAAGVLPFRRANTLSGEEVTHIYEAIRTILKDAVRAGGSSSKNYVRSSGKMGTYQDQHVVYRRTGEPCVNCGEPIERIVVNGRSSHYCPRCQK
jgi:formamidopyrimidine-DNA glycosylase